MSNYTKTTDFASKDGLASGTALKALKGTELGLEFDNIATMSATKVDSASNASLLSLVLTGSAVPSNGIYLPAANTLGLSSNSAQRATVNSTGNWNLNAPTAGVALTVNGVASQAAANFVSSSTVSVADASVLRASSTANTIQQGPNVSLQDTGATTLTALQHSGGQSELWQFNGSWAQQWRVTTAGVFQARDQVGTMIDVGWRDVPQNTQPANYTTVMADRGKSIVLNGANLTVNIATNASVAYPNGTTIVFVNKNATNLTISCGDTLVLAGTATTGSRTLATNGIATAFKSLSTEWIISGSGLT